MKKQLSITVGCLLLMVGLAFGDASLTFNNGTLTPDSGVYTAGSSFTLGLSATVTDSGSSPLSNLAGYSLWIATGSANTGYFSITNRDLSGSNFTDPNSPGISYPQAILPEPGGSSHGGNPDDLGATGNAFPTNATYFLQNLTIAISPSTPVGTYTIFNTTTRPNPSEANESGGSFRTADFAQAAYTITVLPSLPQPPPLAAAAAIPEPAAGILMLNGIVLPWLACIRRKQAASRATRRKIHSAVPTEKK